MTDTKVIPNDQNKVKEGYPTEPHILIRRNETKLTSEFWTPNSSKRFPVINFVKNCILTLSFEWTTWGNSSKSLKDQTMQEVTNFGILSALTLALSITLACIVDGNDSWAGGDQYSWLQAMGLLFNISCTSLVIALLSSAFFLLLINETPEGIAIEMLIDHLGVWLRVPGVTFIIGVYGFAGIMMLWILHTFNLYISLCSVAVATIVASVVLFTSFICGMVGLHKIMNFGVMTITSDEAVTTLLDIYVKHWATLHTKKHQYITGYRRENFLNWLLKEYECCEYCDITLKRLENVLEGWEMKMATTTYDNGVSQIFSVDGKNQLSL